MVHNVAIIGAGQLGRRHLQGLVKSGLALRIDVVDTGEASRRAVEEFIASSAPGSLPPIQVHAKMEALPPDLGLAVIATNSKERLNALEKLMQISKVRHLVLEKFLFGDSEQYEQAGRLIANHGVSAWVNTPRRHFNIYRDLRERTRDDCLLQVTVDGGDWGLCCNSVHFVDLIQFLTGVSDVHAVTTKFDGSILASKRPGYVELTGEIAGKVGPTRFVLRSIHGSTKAVSVTLHYKQRTIFVAEGAGTAWMIGDGPIETFDFRFPYQSEMTGVIANQLLKTNACDLPPYEESVIAHLPLLHAIAQRAGQVTGAHAICAIT